MREDAAGVCRMLPEAIRVLRDPPRDPQRTPNKSVTMKISRSNVPSRLDVTNGTDPRELEEARASC